MVAHINSVSSTQNVSTKGWWGWRNGIERFQWCIRDFLDCFLGVFKQIFDILLLVFELVCWVNVQVEKQWQIYIIPRKLKRNGCTNGSRVLWMIILSNVRLRIITERKGYAMLACLVWNFTAIWREKKGSS